MRKILATILLVFFIGGSVVFHFVGPTKVSGSSMAPILEDGDRVLLNTFKKNYERGDIVVFQTSDDKLFIKRVVGIEGDLIEIKDKSVHLNGKKLDEPYIHGQGTLFGLEMTVPKDHLYVIGDNRGNSVDSRVMGAIPESDVIGSLMVRVLPIFR